MKKWKSALSFILSLAMIMSMLTVPVFAAEGDGTTYTDGSYSATATVVPDEYEDFDAYEIEVEVTIAQGQISSVAYTADNTFGDEDNATYADRAMNGRGSRVGVASQIISSQGVSGVDAVSGATCTSNAILTAVSTALSQAKAPDQPDQGGDNNTGDDNDGDNQDPDAGDDGTEDGDEGDQEGDNDPDEGDEELAEDCYVLMNVPYAVFYAKLNNGEAVDIVSSATTSKAGNCSNVYSSGATVSGGMDLNGVVIPVKVSGETYKTVKDLVSDSTADYYVGETLTEDPSVYMELSYADGSYVFSEVKGNTTTVSGVEATITSSTTWGDYQVDLANSGLGKDPASVYGVYFTTSDGSQYAMRQSENLWNPHSYCEFAWSTGVKTSDIHGGILHGAHYASMEGKTITGITYITTTGIETYSLASGLYVAPHHSGKISAVATGDNTLKLYGVPSDLEDVAVSVATSGRGSVTLAKDAAIAADGTVTLDDGNVFDPEKVYNVVVSSSNYAAMSTTVQYTDTVYALMNVPYAVFYGELNNDVAVDIVSSATTTKAGNCANVYSNGATVDGGMDLNGVVVPVQMSKDTYQEIAKLTANDGDDYYISGVIAEPAVYMELTYADGNYEFSAIQGEASTVSGVEATITSSTTWGDYQVDLADRNQGKTASAVYGAYFTTDDGTQYAMRQSENLWTPSNYYEFAWSTGVKTSDIHGGILHGAHYASMEGKNITSITYITAEGIETYELASALYVAPHHEGEISAVTTSANTLKISGVPSDLENVTVTVATSGRGSVTLAKDAAIAVDGMVTLDDGNVFDPEKVYNVVVSSSNYAAMSTTVQYTDTVYALMNVPYAVFYGELNNDVAVDIVSSATTTKAGNCANVYSSGAAVEGGMDLNGVVIPVKMSTKTYNAVKDLVSDETVDYYIGELLTTTPAVYVELTYADETYAFSAIQGEAATVSDVEAAIASSTTWGDYQVDLADSSLGKDASTVYGAYFTTSDGTQYAMRQSENLWNPHNYYEFAWSTGVKNSDIHGGILHGDHYASMEGKTITSITYITSEGITTYNLASGLYVAPHHEGEISAAATSDNTLKVYGVPSDLENVTVSVATSGRGSVTLAKAAVIAADGTVTLDDGNTFVPEKVYNVVVSSSNYAAMTTTVQYAETVYALMNVPYDVFYGELNNDVAVDIVSSATTTKVGNCSNVYSGGAAVENGMDLNGVVVPVQMSLNTYNQIADLVTDSGAAYYISGVTADPAVYMELTYADKKYEFSAIKTTEDITEVNDVEATITSSTTWGDYQTDLADSSLGKDASTVYGAYFTTSDGTQYAMRQSENLWNPHNYYEFAWSTGVKTSDIHGGILHGDHYASMEGKTITSITYITSEGITTYNLASGLYVAPHHEGEISAAATSANTLKISGVPSDLKDVTVTVATSGRGSVTLAKDAVIAADGTVTLDDGKTFEADKVYNVVVSSSNYAAMTTTVVYTPSTDEPGKDDEKDPGNNGDVTNPGDDGNHGDVTDPGNSGTGKDPAHTAANNNNSNNNGNNNTSGTTGTNGKVSSTSKTASSTSTSSSVKTGDEYHMMAWMVVLVLSCAAFTTLVVVRRKKQR